MPELTPELLTSLEMPDDVQLSADGARVAWVAQPYARAGEHPESAIWAAWTDGREPARRWTYGGADTHPRWSPDGTAIAFLSDRARRGTAGLHLAPAAGGEAAPLAVRERAISSFAWSPDGRRIAFVAPDEPGEDDRRRERERDDPVVDGASTPPGRLHLVDVQSREVTALATGSEHVAAVAWAPDGEWLAYVTWPTAGLDDSSRAALHVIGAGGGEPRTLCRAWIGDLAWTADGRRLVFTAPHGLVAHSAYTAWSVPAEGGEPVPFGPGPDDPCCCPALRRPGPAGVPVYVAQGLDSRVECRDPATGEAQPLHVSRGALRGLDLVVTADGPRLATVEATPERPPEVWAGRPGGLGRLSDHHAAVAGIPLGVREPFRFAAADGRELDGVLLRPPDAAPGPLPTVVSVHGGPYWRETAGARLDWLALLPVAGIALLLPNYRGGMGRGRAFAESVYGDVGGAEYGDVMAAVDAAVARGIADPARLGIAGWSQGGFLTAWAVTQTDRFRAGVMGAGVSDWSLMTIASDVPAFESALSGSRPWDGPRLHRADERSPLRHASRVRTPLLIVHGERDQRVPVANAIGFARALRDVGAEVELVVYPREGHSIEERAHSRDLVRRARDWFVRRLVEA